jgi:hypothetical protein
MEPEEDCFHQSDPLQPEQRFPDAYNLYLRMVLLNGSRGLDVDWR